MADEKDIDEARKILDEATQSILDNVICRPPFRLYWNTLPSAKQKEIKATLVTSLSVMADKVVNLSFERAAACK